MRWGLAVLFVGLLAAPATASATIHTGGISFPEPTNPPSIGVPPPPLIEQGEFDHTVSVTYDDQAGTVTIRTEVFDPAHWSKHHSRTNFTLGPHCYQGPERERLYGVWEAGGSSAPSHEGEFRVIGEVNLEGFGGEVYSTGSFDGQAFTLTFQSPDFVNQEWYCFGYKPAGEGGVVEHQFYLNGYSTPSEPEPATPPNG
jgi:hypothetical protein